MRNWNATFAVLLCFLSIQSCYATDEEMSMYVLVQPEKATVFTQELASIVERLGFSAQIGDNTDDLGNTLYGLEARGLGMRVWSQNTYVTTRVDPEQCGEVDESFPDPGQFAVDIESDSPDLSASSIAELAEDIEDGLTDLGYEVRNEAVACSPWVKSGGA